MLALARNSESEWEGRGGGEREFDIRNLLYVGWSNVGAFRAGGADRSDKARPHGHIEAIKQRHLPQCPPMTLQEGYSSQW